MAGLARGGEVLLTEATLVAAGVDPDRAAGVLLHDGVRYHFCSLPCIGAFAAAPDRFAAST